ncbi:MAG TPA: hypothetical protein ENJ28_02995 [Gammaproteobacteria bacterium]|nr:hypothetical protein [Gammaproteobacteria bacterium]
MKNWILTSLLIVCALVNTTVYADGFGGPINNQPIEKNKDPKLNDQNGCEGDPVYLDGTEVYSKVDLEMNGLYPIRLLRMYSSKSDYDSPLGHGWAFAHDRRLFEYPDNSVVIRYGCGWQDRYINTGGTYQTPKDGMEGSLVENGGSYFRTYNDGSKDFYDAEGRLTRSQNPEGHYHTFTYDPAGLIPLTGTSIYSLNPEQPMVVAKNYHLLSIEEFSADDISTGNRVNFEYHPITGRLIKATARTTLDTTGRVITYQHDVTDGIDRGRLEQVIGLENILSTYGYQGTTAFVNSFQEGAGTTPHINTLESGSNRVKTQTHGLNQLTFNYPTISPVSTVSKSVYDDQGQLLYSNVDTTYEFDNEGYVNKIIDRAGNEKVITRDGLNHLKRETFWTNTGTLASPNLVLSRTVDYIFDAENNKLEEKVSTDGQWIRTQWTYDNGWMESETIDSNQLNSTSYRTEYTFYRDSNNIPTNIQQIRRLKDDGSYQVTTLSYDAKNRLTLIQYPDTHKVHIKYENGSLYANHIYHEVNGLESPYLNYRLGYDIRGNINLITDAKLQDTSLVYDDLNRVIQITNPLNEIIYYRYNGKLLDELEIGATVANGEGQLYKLLYTAEEELSEVQRKDDNGSFQTLWTYTYDSAGNMLSAADAKNRQWKYAYDYLDRLTSISDPLTFRAQYEYDILDNVTSVIDAENQETQYTYDALSRVTRITELAVLSNLVTNIKYDPLGNIIEVTGPKNQTTLYNYDRLSRLISETKPLGQTIQYFYDTRNRLDYMLNARNQKIDYAYEDWGQLKNTDFYATPTSTTSVKQRSRSYDFNGNLTSIIDNTLSALPIYTVLYDTLGRIDKLNSFAFLPYKQLDYDYDRYGNVNQLTLNSSNTGNDADWIADYSQQYQYNKKDLLTQATFNASQTHQFDYYPTDELKQIAFNNGTVTDYAYQGNGPLKWIDIAHGGASKEKLNFTYDKVLNVKQMSNNSGIHSFIYDGINRLTNASHPLASNLPTSEDFTYDAAGNREGAANSALYNYDQNNRISLSPSVSNYQFDDDGNLTQRNSDETFVYDYENQLTQYANTTTGVVASYTYDSFGRRIKKEVTQNAQKTTHYLWDGTNIIAEYDGTGSRIKRYSYTADRYAPLQMEDASGIYNVHTDHLDAPVVLTNQVGDVVWRAEYEAYGSTQINEDVDGDLQSVRFDLRRPGQWEDLESGLYYNYFRYYDPSTGRYITSDPIGQLGGINTYSYVRSNPLRWIDPLGLELAIPVSGPGVITGIAVSPIGVGIGIAIFPRDVGAGSDIPGPNPLFNEESDDKSSKIPLDTDIPIIDSDGKQTGSIKWGDIPPGAIIIPEGVPDDTIRPGSGGSVCGDLQDIDPSDFN